MITTTITTTIITTITITINPFLPLLSSNFANSASGLTILDLSKTKIGLYFQIITLMGLFRLVALQDHHPSLPLSPLQLMLMTKPFSASSKRLTPRLALRITHFLTSRKIFLIFSLMTYNQMGRMCLILITRLNLKPSRKRTFMFSLMTYNQMGSLCLLFITKLMISKLYLMTNRFPLTLTMNQVMHCLTVVYHSPTNSL